MGEPGALNWNELLTKDVGRTGAFYADLFRLDEYGDAQPQRAGTTRCS